MIWGYPYFWKHPYNWLVFHPLYTAKKPGSTGHCSTFGWAPNNSGTSKVDGSTVKFKPLASVVFRSKKPINLITQHFGWNWYKLFHFILIQIDPNFRKKNTLPNLLKYFLYNLICFAVSSFWIGFVAGISEDVSKNSPPGRDTDHQQVPQVSCRYSFHTKKGDGCQEELNMDRKLGGKLEVNVINQWLV